MGHDVDGVNRIRQLRTVRLPPLGAGSGRNPPLPTGKGPTMNHQQPPNGPANPYRPNRPNRPYAPYCTPYPPSGFGASSPQPPRPQGPWPPAEATKRRGLPVWLIVTIAAVTTLVLLITVGTITTTQTRTVTHADDAMTASPTAPTSSAAPDSPTTPKSNQSTIGDSVGTGATHGDYFSGGGADATIYVYDQDPGFDAYVKAVSDMKDKWYSMSDQELLETLPTRDDAGIDQLMAFRAILGDLKSATYFGDSRETTNPHEASDYWAAKTARLDELEANYLAGRGLGYIVQLKNADGTVREVNTDANAAVKTEKTITSGYTELQNNLKEQAKNKKDTAPRTQMPQPTRKPRQQQQQTPEPSTDAALLTQWEDAIRAVPSTIGADGTYQQAAEAVATSVGFTVDYSMDNLHRACPGVSANTASADQMLMAYCPTTPTTIYFNTSHFDYAAQVTDPYFVDAARHELAHAMIHRICGTPAPSTLAQTEAVTNSYATHYFGATQLHRVAAPELYGMSTQSDADADAIHAGQCKVA